MVVFSLIRFVNKSSRLYPSEKRIIPFKCSRVASKDHLLFLQDVVFRAFCVFFAVVVVVVVVMVMVVGKPGDDPR